MAQLSQKKLFLRVVSTKLGYTGDAILPSISDFAKRIDIYPYISALAEEGQFELAADTDNFLFKSHSNSLKLPFTIIGNEKADFRTIKLPFALEALEVMLLKQIQNALGTGYLQDMPEPIDAAKKAYNPASVQNKSAFRFLKNYTNDQISFVSEEAKIGLFFKVQDLGGHELLFPELRLSSDSVQETQPALLSHKGTMQM